MCIVFVSAGEHPKYKIVLLSNRDETFDRPTLRSDFWLANLSSIGQPVPNASSPSSSDQSPQQLVVSDPTEGVEGVQVLAGRDAIRGGTWLGLSKSGRFSVITNFQERHSSSDDGDTKSRIRSLSILPNVKSRGDLPIRFLCSNKSREEYLSEVREEKDCYPGFSLIVGDTEGLSVFSNRDPKSEIVSVEVGETVGLTNSLLYGGWHKEKRGVELAKSAAMPDPDELSKLATNCDYSTTHSPASSELTQLLSPLLGVLTDTQGPEGFENQDLYHKAGEMSPVFVDALNFASPSEPAHLYGTRCNIIITIDYQNRATFFERSLDVETNQWEARVFHFPLTSSN